MDPATDLDILVRKGFSEDIARSALQRAHGDVRHAALILRDGNRDTSWLNETVDQWIDNTPSTAMASINAESRALTKSPVYVRVGSWTRRDEKGNSLDEIQYVLTVIMRDRRQWTLRRTFGEFYNFWMLLPSSACSGFQNTFPQPGIFSFLGQSDEQIEHRRLKLEEWIRELCLSENCMSNKKIIEVFFKFLEEEKHPLPPADTSTTKTVLLSTPIDIPKPSYNSISHYKVLHSFPLLLPVFMKSLPCRVDIATIFASNPEILTSSISGKDTSDEQLARDIERDRVVVNGHRMLGSRGGLVAVLNTAVDVAQHVITTGGMKPVSPVILQDICKSALRHASRTESAFLSHTALCYLLDMNKHADVLVVPESSLAEALMLDFSLIPTPTPPISSPSTIPEEVPPKLLPGSSTIVIPSHLRTKKASPQVQLPPVKEKVLCCDIRAGTVYRLTNSETMETLLQLKVTYCTQVIEKPITTAKRNTLPENNVSGAPQSQIPTTHTSSTAYLILEKETQTTIRDWKG
eukprot:gene6916-14049_t